MVTNPLRVSEIMHEFLKEDIINVKSWFDLGDCNYEHDHKDDSIPDSGVVYCNIEHIHKFFKKCESTVNNYVVVSGFSDYGVAYQQQHPVGVDMLKWIPFVEHMIPELGYNPLVIPPRCDTDNCDLNDTYSVKCYSHTMSTFKGIPSNVTKWFLVNSMLSQDRIQGIPLGIGKDATDDILGTNQYELSHTDNWVYVNWQNYTLERKYLKSFFLSNGFDWVTYVEEPKEFKEYLDELSRHVYAICPPGNGLDCYRILECIYVGTIPIVFNSPCMDYLKDLPILIIDNFDELNIENLKSQYESISQKMQDSGVDKAKFSYWKNEISQAARALNE